MRVGEARPTPSDHRVTGIAYILGPDDAGGWAIWPREQTSGPVLRFGPDERRTAEQLFQQLEFFERLTPETVVPVGLDRDDPLPPPLRRRGGVWRGWPRLAKAAITFLVIAAFAYVATELPLDADPDPLTAGSLFGGQPEAPLAPEPDAFPEPPPDAPAPSTLPGVEVYSNPSGGYLFSYPDSWTVEVQGSTAILADPDDSVRVIFGRAQGGSLARASATVLAEVMRSHDGVRTLDSSREPTAQGLRALIVGGTLLHDGVEGRFLAIAVKGPAANTSISVFFSAGSEVLEKLDDIRAVLSSYRVGSGS